MLEEETRVLLVDDEQPLLRSMEKTFLRAGYDVEVANDISEGWKKFDAARQGDEPFHIAVVDLNMPNFEGVETEDAGLDLLARIVETVPDFPVIVLTAFDAVSKAKRAVSLGARDFFVKGREEGLLELVRKVLGE